MAQATQVMVFESLTIENLNQCVNEWLEGHCTVEVVSAQHGTYTAKFDQLWHTLTLVFKVK